MEQAKQLAKAFDAPIRLVHVLEPQPSYSAYGFTVEEYPAMQNFQQEARVIAEKKLEEFSERLTGEGYDVTQQLVIGTPTHAMAELLENLDDAVLVLGTHGHNLVGSILMGSVAESLVRRAVVPTMVVPVG